MYAIHCRMIHRLQQDNTMDTSAVPLTDSSSTNDVIMEHSGSHDETPSVPGSHDANATGDLITAGSHDPTTATVSTHTVTTEPVATRSSDLGMSGSCDPSTSSHTTVLSDSVITEPVALGLCDPDVSHDTVKVAHDAVNITANTSVSPVCGSHDSITRGQVVTRSHDLSSCSHEPHSSPSNFLEQDNVSPWSISVFNICKLQFKY